MFLILTLPAPPTVLRPHEVTPTALLPRPPPGSPTFSHLPSGQPFRPHPPVYLARSAHRTNQPAGTALPVTPAAPVRAFVSTAFRGLATGASAPASFREKPTSLGHPPRAPEGPAEERAASVRSALGASGGAAPLPRDLGPQLRGRRALGCGWKDLTSWCTGAAASPAALGWRGAPCGPSRTAP